MSETSEKSFETIIESHLIENGDFSYRGIYE